MKTENRKTNTIRNIVVEMITYFGLTIIDLLLRIVISHYIGVEFLGLNGLFSSVISVFSIAEAGFGSVMWFFLYEPVAKNDKERIKSIVNFSKKIYLIVAGIILILSVLILPFMQYFINSSIDINNVRVYFILYALSSVCSYLLIYKTVLLGASQKNYIYKLFQILVSCVIGVVQIIFLIVFKSFYAYLLLKIASSLLINILTTIYINKNYNYIKEKEYLKLDKTETKEIIKKTGAMFFSKVGASVSRSIDNILITYFLTLTIVGYYSNYLLILTAVSTLIINTINGSCASVGNLWVTAETNKIETVFNRVQFLENWIITFCAICICTLSEDFILLFFGSDYQLGISIGILISIIIYFEKINLPASIFKDAKGLFWNDRFRPLIEAGLNICFSILFLKLFGLIGILFGTLASILLTAWYQPYVLYKFGFNKSFREFLIKTTINFVEFVFIGAITYFVCFALPHTIVGFVVKIILCLIVPNLLLLLFNFKNQHFKYYVSFAKELLHKLKK